MTTQVSKLPSNLIPSSHGFIHPHKNIHIRITSSSNIEPIIKAASKWMKIKDLEQDIYAQSDEIWTEFEKKLTSKLTDIEIYSLFKSIPKPAITYKDLCHNTVAHRLILALKKQDPEVVDGVWYLLQDVIRPHMEIANDFGHTAWELMGSVPTAFEKVLAAQGYNMLYLIPMRTWRKHQVYLNAWNLLTVDQRLAFARTCKKNHLDLLCYLTQNNPAEISELSRGNTYLLEGCNLDIKVKYPFHAEHLLINLIELNMYSQTILFTT